MRPDADISARCVKLKDDLVYRFDQCADFGLAGSKLMLCLLCFGDIDTCPDNELHGSRRVEERGIGPRDEAAASIAGHNVVLPRIRELPGAYLIEHLASRRHLLRHEHQFRPVFPFHFVKSVAGDLFAGAVHADDIPLQIDDHHNIPDRIHYGGDEIPLLLKRGFRLLGLGHIVGQRDPAPLPPNSSRCDIISTSISLPARVRCFQVPL